MPKTVKQPTTKTDNMKLIHKVFNKKTANVILTFANREYKNSDDSKLEFCVLPSTIYNSKNEEFEGYGVYVTGRISKLVLANIRALAKAAQKGKESRYIEHFWRDSTRSIIQTRLTEDSYW